MYRIARRRKTGRPVLRQDRPDQCIESLTAATGADALQALDSAVIARGVLLSMGYMAGAPEIGAAPGDVAADTRAENGFVVPQAAASCRRLRAFISVNPDSAMGQIGYWARYGGADWLKLHLANSAFDFGSARRVRRLAAVFHAAHRAGLAIVIHPCNMDPA